MKTMLGRRRCIWCTKWLPIDHASVYCSDKCEKEHIKESAYWESYKEKNRQGEIQYRKKERMEHNECLNCGKPILQKDHGRFRRYCGSKCKQEAFRLRKTGLKMV